MKKTLSVMLVLVLCLSMLIACGAKNSGEKISAKIILIDKDDAQYEYDIKCDNGATLRDALHENGLIDEDEYSAMFVQNIDGHMIFGMTPGCRRMRTASRSWVPLTTLP